MGEEDFLTFDNSGLPNHFTFFSCEPCKQDFNRQHDLERHLTQTGRHCNIKGFVCDNCGLGYYRKDALMVVVP